MKPAVTRQEIWQRCHMSATSSDKVQRISDLTTGFLAFCGRLGLVVLDVSPERGEELEPLQDIHFDFSFGGTSGRGLVSTGIFR